MRKTFESTGQSVELLSTSLDFATCEIIPAKETSQCTIRYTKATTQFRRRAFCRTAPRLLKRPVCGCFAGLVTHNGSVESMLIISTLFASSLSCRLEVCHMGKDSGRSLLFFFELSFKLPVSRSFSSRAFLRWCFLHQERAVEIPKIAPRSRHFSV